MRRACYWTMVAAVAAFSPSGCGFFLSYDGISDGAGDAAPRGDGGDGGIQPDAMTGEGGGEGGDGSAPSCPGTHGPTPVDLGPTAFCIDSTEVTNADYAEFLAANPSLPAQPAACAWNTSLLPMSGWPAPAQFDKRPVTYVDWCDAYAYCAWAGKHLCGKIGGGGAQLTSYQDPATSQWFYACSHGGDGKHAFPYGATYDGARCNDVDNGTSGQVVDVGSLARCTGGFDGVFDMSGNAEEWEDSCAGDAGAADLCRHRGGGPSDSNVSASCAANNTVRRDAATTHHGIRCCGR